MASDQHIVAAYNRQLEALGDPSTVFLAWAMSGELRRGEITMDDLVDGFKAVTQTDPPPVSSG